MTTQGDMIDRIVTILGDTSTAFRTYLQESVPHVLHSLYDYHDWNFKHKTDTFNSVSGTEEYDLSTPTPDLRSSEDIELLYDKTNGVTLKKVDLKDIRRTYPKEDTSGTPQFYAPWGATSIILSDEPNAICTYKFMYLANPTLPADDTDDFQTDCGIPVHINHVIERMLLLQGMLYLDDNRYTAFSEELYRILLPRAIQADMKHLESTARIKHIYEEFGVSGDNFNDYLRNVFWGRE